jgi:hypothetical protein
VAFQIPDDELSRRLSIAIAITERRGYLLTWFFAAPHDSELQQLTDERVIFDSAPPAKVMGATEPGGGEASSSTSTAGPGGSPSSAPAASAPPSVPAPATAPVASGTSSASAPTSPSLLRPGETMDSQQGKGAHVPNKQKQSD